MLAAAAIVGAVAFGGSLPFDGVGAALTGAGIAVSVAAADVGTSGMLGMNGGAGFEGDPVRTGSAVTTERSASFDAALRGCSGGGDAAAVEVPPTNVGAGTELTVEEIGRTLADSAGEASATRSILPCGLALAPGTSAGDGVAATVADAAPAVGAGSSDAAGDATGLGAVPVCCPGCGPKRSDASRPRATDASSASRGGVSIGEPVGETAGAGEPEAETGGATSGSLGSLRGGLPVIGRALAGTSALRSSVPGSGRPWALSRGWTGPANGLRPGLSPASIVCGVA